MELTEAIFWEEYWMNCILPSCVNMKFSFERCLANKLKQILSGCHGEVLEIGCAPGKWLDFFYNELGLRPSGIEYSTAGMKATIKNFSILRTDYGDVWDGDFFSMPVVKQFDVVISLGFIEHFSNPDEVVQRHLQWLKPGGTLVLGVPNFRGIYKPIQSVLDPSILEKHNTKIMNLAYFRNLGKLLKLEPKFIEYLGSFEPDLFILSNNKLTLEQYILKEILGLARRVRRIRALDTINNRYISSYILAVYEKGSAL